MLKTYCSNDHAYYSMAYDRERWDYYIDRMDRAAGTVERMSSGISSFRDCQIAMYAMMYKESAAREEATRNRRRKDVEPTLDEPPEFSLS